MFTKISKNLGSKHEMANLVMLLIGGHKTANLYLFKSYPTIIESIREYFIFYNKQRKRSIIFHIYMYNKKYPTLTVQNQYLNVLFFITNKEKEKVESQCSNISSLYLNTH